MSYILLYVNPLLKFLVYGTYETSRKSQQQHHSGHRGIVTSRRRAYSSVWWPRINDDAENYILSVMFVRGKESYPLSHCYRQLCRSVRGRSRERPVLLARSNVPPSCWLLFQACQVCSSEDRYECNGGDQRSQGNLHSAWHPRRADFGQHTAVFRLCFPRIFVVLWFSSRNQQFQVSPK